MSPPLHLVRGESKQKWDLDLDSRIRFPLTLSYTHITMQPIEHLAWTPGRENKNPETSHDKVDFATQRSPDVRGEISVFMLESDSHCIFPIVILRNTMLPDCGWHDEKKNSYKTLPRRPARDENWNQNFNDTDNLQQAQHPQRIQITLHNSTDTRLISPRCGFWCQRWDVGLHVRFRFPLCLSFRHFSRHQLSKHFTLLKTRNIFHVAATPPGTKRIKNRGEFSTLIPESDSHWHLPILISQCNHLHILLGHLAERTKIQKPLLTRLSLPRWRVRCQKARCLSSYRSQIPTVSLLSSCSAAQMLRRKTAKTESNESFVSLPICLIRNELKKQMWDLDLDSRIRFPLTTFLSSHHNATNWTPGLNTWHRQQKHRTNSTDRRFILATLRSQMSEVRCLSSCRSQIPHCIFPIVILRNTMLPDCGWHDEKKKLLQDAATDALLETKTGARISVTRTTCNRLNIWQRIQITLPTLLTHSWSLPRCGFGCQRWDVCLHVRFRFPLCLFLSSFFHDTNFRNISHYSTRASFTSPLLHLVRRESKTEVSLDLDSRIRFPLTPSYPHITMQPFAHLAWHLAERTKIQETSTDKDEFATLKSRMSELRCLSSCWSQIPTVSFLFVILRNNNLWAV